MVQQDLYAILFLFIMETANHKICISKIFRNALADDKSMETSLNSMWQKASVLKTPGVMHQTGLVQ